MLLCINKVLQIFVTIANAADLRLKNDRIIGNAIFNKTLVSYLFDTGADKTLSITNCIKKSNRRIQALNSSNSKDTN
ncbi:hypothetical protein BpHYR1_036166 [Brachionus plicatilis]|uniref:Peptidase A2 domain-containing protein n=1 Tax=Brachionus plicatilis TaxID=10195 RepID=A0A3M7ST94_BRAPC|nr:hypothetical protein BpHYR1_036166 [Brachionus plicatilis]